MTLRKSTIAIIMAATFIASCKKKKDSMNYVVNGLADVALTQYTDTTVLTAITTQYIGGPQEVLTLTPTSLPAGVTVSPAFIAGTPSFPAVFTFSVYSATAGAKPITITAKSATTNKTYTFNLNVAANSDCAKPMKNEYFDAADSSSEGVNTYVIAARYSAATPNAITLQDAYGDDIIAHLNCDAQTVTTDSMNAPWSGYSISAGTGTFSPGKIVVTYKKYGFSGVTTIVATYIKP